MTICEKCGGVIEENATVCSQCGTAVGSVSPAVQNSDAGADHEETKSTASFFNFASKILTKLGGKDITDSFTEADRLENMAISGICYISPFFFLPLLACPKSKLARHHANNALLILIASVASGIIFGIIGGILGAIAATLWDSVWGLALIFAIANVIVDIVGGLIGLALVVFSALNICACLNLKVVELPFLSKLKIIK